MTDEADTPDETGTGPEAGTRPDLTAAQVLRAAREQFAELTGLQPEGVSRFERTEDGWTVEAEAVEVARIPETMSVMALYELTLGPDGLLTGYRRVRRYERGRSDAR
ncbi:gas vesicle protein GvpO [Streptomyces roseifaciens]|uniref:gas vesicle protein GvpO n=1 Tax=Streptomyces roseifaciens TaxID=1488406 RepID=UPI0009A006AB|nr:gas vesicle protein GvpO [Streptomyces roseifaciens]